LHVLGGSPNGINQVQYAAHWDLQEPVEFCLNGFPEDERNYRQIGVDVINEMNIAMEKIGAVKPGQKAFKVSDRKMKYHFDLRCPSITWVDEPRLSFGAPLGIGLTNADVETGEIIWGGAVVWGGLIDYIVNIDSESASDALSRNLHEMMSQVEVPTQNPYFVDIQHRLDVATQNSPGFKTLQDMNHYGNFRNSAEIEEILTTALAETQRHLNEGSLIRSMPQVVDGVLQDSNGDRVVDYGALAESLNGILSTTNLNQLKATISENHSDDLNEIFRVNLGTEEDHISNLHQFANLGTSAEYSQEDRQRLRHANQAQVGSDSSFASIMSDYNNRMRHSIPDLENTIEKHYYSWMSASAQMGPLEKLAASKSVIKNVALHELGHVVGLGHQFEGNRLPQRGMVPDKIYNFYAEEAKTHSNYTSIMDYQSGHTEVALPYEKVKMQAQDELVLAYLYKQEYSTYAAGDEDFTFFKVPPNGVIPDQVTDDGKLYVTRYMPQCSDMDAWLAYSPYCRRWDRGSSAPSIVEESFGEYTDSFISRINSFTEATGGNPWWMNYRLWSSTYDVMNRSRAISDEKRYQLSNNQVYSEVFEELKKDEEALLNFSKACINPVEAPEGWNTRFAKLALRPTPTAAGSITLRGMQQSADYQSLYNIYKNVTSTMNVRALDEQGFMELEDRMYEQGVAFTELQKLCRASKKSLDVSKVLLSLKGPDHINMDYDDAIAPTGLRGGNARYDYSRLFGRYNQLGLLPIKVAALDVLTNTASTLRYGWWQVPKPKYNDANNGKYGYFSLYPEEFTDVVGTAVKNNMGFGGTVLQDSASMSIANLYMSYFLFRTFFLSNDGKVNGFKSNYIDELKAQTRFNVDVYPVLLDSVTKPSEPKNKVFGFNPRLFNFAKRQLIDLPEAYMLPDRRVIVRGNDSEIIMPLTKIRFLSQSSAYVWALIVTYDNASYDDPLEGYTVKNAVSTLTNQELDKCMGGNSGLSSFFNSDEFEGFLVDPRIAIDKEAQNNFEISVDEAFAKYEDSMKPNQIGCEESEKGIGLISATALSLNGWIIPQVYDYIRK
ncbi:MAG: hypothetical protein HRT44_06810, partial [Bdellovibrionales bacterium]|nr:hypothetical protein [Bdellovibrionales bacterium]NQZ18949.1 hypothetical protein [Bdellovibrionales bacterium]